MFPQHSYITTAVVSSPTTGSRVLSSALRRLIALAVLELLIVLFAAVIADAVSRRRADRRALRAAPAPAERAQDEPQYDDLMVSRVRVPESGQTAGPTPAVHLRFTNGRSRPGTAAVV